MLSTLAPPQHQQPSSPPLRKNLIFLFAGSELFLVVLVLSNITGGLFGSFSMGVFHPILVWDVS